MFEVTIPDLSVLKDLFFAIQVPIAWLFILIGLDFLLAVLAVWKVGKFDMTKIADFIIKGLTKALALVAIAIVGVSLGMEPVFQDGVFYATYAVIMLSEASSIFEHLLELGVLPEALKPILEKLALLQKK